MAVGQTPDGRWYVAGRPGFFPNEPKRRRLYFGRGAEAQLAALKYNKELGGIDPNSRIRVPVRDQIKDLKTVIINETYTKICAKIDQDRKNLFKKNSNKPEIAEIDIVKNLIYRIAKSKKEIVIHVQVKTPNGFADIVTSKEIIEVKNIYNWKQAIGQVNAYHVFMPHLQKRIHLFGSSKMRGLKGLILAIKNECRRNKIKATMDLL